MDSLVVLLLMTLISGFTALQQDVQVKLGQDVTLQCQISTDETISVLKWSRPDLNTDGYVCFYRNRRFYENYQHPSFYGRVKLRNPEMKDGDVSVILENVTFNDAGMYECLIAVRNPGGSNRAHTEISHFINLTVTDETHENVLEQQIMERGDADGEVDPLTAPVAAVTAVVAAVVGAVAIVGFVAFEIFKRSRKPSLVMLPEAADL